MGENYFKDQPSKTQVQGSENTMPEYSLEHYSHNISVLALRSLLYEISVTPKPGLVDRFNNGAHKDMDFFSFIDSSCSLVPYFKTCAQLGLCHYDLTDKEFLLLLRPAGISAEEIMFTATRGVNTHKGAIFSLGLLCAAMGRIIARGAKLDERILCDEVKNIAQYTLSDYSRIKLSSELTGGEAAYVQHGLTGVRGEAASGFFHVREIALPVLRYQLEKGSTYNDAGMIVLLHLMGKIEDTNVIKRRGKKALEHLHHTVEKLLRQGSLSPAQVIELDEILIQQNISPGGCADLLAITFFIHFATTQYPPLQRFSSV